MYNINFFSKSVHYRRLTKNRKWNLGIKLIISLFDYIFFLCLFRLFRLTREFFLLFTVVVTITGEGLLSFTYSRHSWPWSGEGSLEASKIFFKCSYRNLLSNTSPFVIVNPPDSCIFCLF